MLTRKPTVPKFVAAAIGAGIGIAAAKAQRKAMEDANEAQRNVAERAKKRSEP